MDEHIAAMDAERDADLMLCVEHGVAYQEDMTAGRVSYGDDYFAKVCAYEDTDIARTVNVGRVGMLSRHLSAGASVLDIGAGSGAFVRVAIAAGFAAMGYDVIPQTEEWLRYHNLYADKPSEFDAVTMWDTIEHLEHPGAWINRLNKGARLFASIPVFDDLRRIRESKHYRPGEHLYYWTARGFIEWMAMHGYRLLEQSEHETSAGREDIGAFAFVRNGA